MVRWGVDMGRGIPVRVEAESGFAGESCWEGCKVLCGIRPVWSSDHDHNHGPFQLGDVGEKWKEGRMKEWKVLRTYG